jgi:hypothetical protein
VSDYAEMADGPIEPAQPIEVPTPHPPYIRYAAWEPAAPPKTGPQLLHDEVQQLRSQVTEMAASMQKMQESICHLELHVHRLLNQEGDL